MFCMCSRVEKQVMGTIQTFEENYLADTDMAPFGSLGLCYLLFNGHGW